MHRTALLAIDLACVALATTLSLILRDNLVFSYDRFVELFPYLVVSILSAAIFFAVLGINRGIWRFTSLPDYLWVVVAVLLAILGALSTGFAFNRLEGVPRALPVLQVFLATAFMTGARIATRLRHARRSQVPITELTDIFKGETVLVLGLSWIADLFLKSVRELGGNNVNIAGVIGPKHQNRGRLFQTFPVLGTPEDLQVVLQLLGIHGVFVDRIVVAMPFDALSVAARAELEHVEAGTSINIDYFAERLGLVGPENAHHARREPVVLNERKTGELCLSLQDHLQHLVANRKFWMTKRIFDFVVAAIAIIAAAPLFLLVGLLVAIDVGLPIFFWQQRPGRLGRRFKIYKFRTMKAAHDRKGRKLSDDERLSEVGRFVRRMRFDELPQLFNILIGQMSFVGPRPLLPVDQAKEHSARLAIRPGLSGWAQVNGGREVSVADKAAMDVWYVHNANFLLDLKIILATVHMVIFGERPNPAVVRDAWRYLQQHGFASVALNTVDHMTTAEQMATRRVA
jgi:lipopolysaccharide/colanic/teichoic acid biosynthesis glycosyltransferase